MDSNEFAKTIVFQDDLVEPVPKFYVVSPKKFLILFIMTLGLYEVYWFYKNWSNFKQNTKQAMWPIARGIFSIFFAHSLFEEVNNTLKANQTKHDWSPSKLATIFVICAIISRVIDRFTGDEGSQAILGFGLMIVFYAGVCWALFHAQLAINNACGDAQGLSNNNLTPGNWVWIILGALLWASIIFSSFILVNLSE